MNVEQEARAVLAAWAVKDLLDTAREYWKEYEAILDVEEQQVFWEYFDSQERTMLKNHVNGSYKPAVRS